MMLVYVLIILFIVLIMLHVVKGDIIEGATGSSDANPEYKAPPLSKDPLYLATLNASNVTYLYNQIGQIQNVKNQIVDLSGQVLQNARAIQALNEQLQQTSSSVTGGRDPNSKEPLPQPTGLN